MTVEDYGGGFTNGGKYLWQLGGADESCISSPLNRGWAKSFASYHMITAFQNQILFNTFQKLYMCMRMHATPIAKSYTIRFLMIILYCFSVYAYLGLIV